jgi:hypothetical protein
MNNISRYDERAEAQRKAALSGMAVIIYQNHSIKVSLDRLAENQQRQEFILREINFEIKGIKDEIKRNYEFQLRVREEDELRRRRLEIAKNMIFEFKQEFEAIRKMETAAERLIFSAALRGQIELSGIKPIDLPDIQDKEYMQTLSNSLLEEEATSKALLTSDERERISQLENLVFSEIPRMKELINEAENSKAPIIAQTFKKFIEACYFYDDRDAINRLSMELIGKNVFHIFLPKEYQQLITFVATAFLGLALHFYFQLSREALMVSIIVFAGCLYVTIPAFSFFRRKHANKMIEHVREKICFTLDTAQRLPEHRIKLQAEYKHLIKRLISLTDEWQNVRARLSYFS